MRDTGNVRVRIRRARRRAVIEGIRGPLATRFRALGLVAQFSLIGFCVSLVLASAIAVLADRVLSDLLLAQLATRAADQVALVFEERLTPQDFQAPVTPARLTDIAARLDPSVRYLRERTSGIIRLYIYNREGTILYSDVVNRRGQSAGVDTDRFDDALAGSIGTEVTSLETPENADLKPRYGDALEVYVPFRLNGQVVGVYEVYQDLDSIRPVRPIVLVTVFGGFTVLFVALLLVVRDAADRLRRQAQERDRLAEQLRQSQKMEVVGQLAGGVAHDFNNLLTVIGGFSELLLAQNDLTPDQREAVEEIVRAGDSAASLTRQLLVFSRREIVVPREIDLNQVVVQTGKMLRRLIGEDITCIIATEYHPAMVHADPGQIEQILMNLAANARDAMPQGGRLTITTATVELSEAFAFARRDAQPGPYVLLAVSDTGTGMNQATQDRMFEPFFTTKAPGKGTGLGLAAVYGIVKQNNGSIEVSSELGRGTTMKIYLPRLTEPASSDSSTLEDAVPVGSETILLVEDEAPLRRFTAIALRSFGYRVLEAESGDRAVELSRAEPGSIHLLVTDLIMPGMSGRDVAERLIVERPGLNVLLVSGYTDDVVIRHGLVAGEVEFLQKPFSPSLLGRRVREVLDTPVGVGAL